MTGYAVTSATGRVITGEADQLFMPRTVRTGRRGVILGHGAQNPNQWLDSVNMPNSCKLAAAIAGAGIPCLAGTFGGDDVANDTALADYETAVTKLQTLTGCATDKTLFVGVSMGATNAIRYAQAHPTMVAGIVGIVPAVDPNDILQNNRGGLGSIVGTAWGVTAPTPLPTRGLLSDPANEALIAGLFSARWYYSTGDTVVLPALVTAFATATGTTAVSASTKVHGDGPVGDVSTADVVAFLVANGA